MRARLQTASRKFASLLPNRLEAVVRQHFDAWWKFTVVGAAGLLLQVMLQHIEVVHGYKNDLIWLSTLQGAVLANIGLFVNWKWTFRGRKLPFWTVVLSVNFLRFPHWLASTGLFILLLQVWGLAYYLATPITAASVGIGSFAATSFWAMRDRNTKIETA